MREQDKKIRKISIDISNESDRLNVPLSDIEAQVRKALRTGASTEQVKKMVPKMLRDSTTRDYRDGRKPKEQEILVYSLCDKMEELFSNPE